MKIKKVLMWPFEAVLEAGAWILKKAHMYLWIPTVKYARLTILVLTVSLTVCYGLWRIWDHNLDLLKEVPAVRAPQELQSIYDDIARVTDVSNRVPPLGMLKTLSSFTDVSAFTTGKVVYFTFKADMVLNNDEKALVMGHEIAHVILHHTDNAFSTFVSSYSNENELMADNVGASWADKAGYNVCKGREVFLKFYLWGGNSMNSSHPPNLLRYENLAHYCKSGEK